VARMAEGPSVWPDPSTAGHAAAAAALRSAPFRRHLAAQLRRAPTEVGAWAGHSVEVLMRVYAKCMTGLEDVWIGRMNDALHLEDPQRNDGRRSARQDGEDPE